MTINIFVLATTDDRTGYVQFKAADLKEKDIITISSIDKAIIYFP
ncbi:MAG: hypothetical protein ACT4ON_05220 [Bacteroidota bacterium]